MRIIQICTADSLGGLELYFASCCRELKNRENEILAVVSPGTKLHKILANEGVSCAEVQSGTLKRFRTVKKQIKSFQPDVVHIHHKKDLFLGALLRRFVRTKFKYVHTRQMDLPSKKKNLYHTFLYSSIDLLIAITDHLKSQIMERINIAPNKVISLHYGVPLVEPNMGRCETLNLDEEKFNMAVVARIDNKKEQHVMVEAVSYLKSEGKNVTAHFLGGSTDQEYLDKVTTMISESDLGNEITLSGFVEDPQELMSCFDLVVLTTGNETFGLVLPEAMRMGVAVIGANGGGVPEIIDHKVNGLLFKPGDGKDLAEKIKVMMEDEVRNQLATEGKKKADEQFEIGAHFEKLEKAFA